MTHHLWERLHDSPVCPWKSRFAEQQTRTLGDSCVVCYPFLQSSRGYIRNSLAVCDGEGWGRLAQGPGGRGQAHILTKPGRLLPVSLSHNQRLKGMHWLSGCIPNLLLSLLITLSWQYLLAAAHKVDFWRGTKRCKGVLQNLGYMICKNMYEEGKVSPAMSDVTMHSLLVYME